MSETRPGEEPQSNEAKVSTPEVFSGSDESGHACGDRWGEGPSRWCAICS